MVSALAARRWACARLIGSAVVIAVGLGESRTTFVSGTKGRAFRGVTLIRRCRTHRDRRVVHVSVVTDRRCPVSLALCAGAYWRPRLAPPRVRSGGSRVPPPSSSFPLAPNPGSLGRSRGGGFVH